MYKFYGGRGIKICEEWEKDFMEFYKWSVKSGFKQELQIDRINNDGNYEPSNCRWVTPEENKRKENRRPTERMSAGVYRSGNKYGSRIYVNKQWYYCGLFDTKEDAKEERKKYYDGWKL